MQKYSVNKHVLSCKNCGVYFFSSKNRLKYTAKFCSNYCKNKFRMDLPEWRQIKSIEIKKYIKTHGHPCKGIKLSEERKNFVSKLWKGKKQSEEHIRKKAAKLGVPNYACMGNKSNFWKGGITPLVTSIRNSLENKTWKRNVFLRDNYTCQECSKKGGRLAAHHKVYFNILLNNFIKTYSQFSIIEDKETLERLAISFCSFWDINNGLTLCKECHENIHKKPVAVNSCY